MSEPARETSSSEGAPPTGEAGVLAFGWPEILGPPAREALQQALLAYVTPRRWFRAKNRRAREARVVDLVPLAGEHDVLALVDIAFDAGDPERYLVPLATVVGDAADEVAERTPHAVIARLAPEDGRGARVQASAGANGPAALVDGLATGTAAEALRVLVEKSATSRGQAGALIGRARPAWAEFAAGVPRARVAPLEQTNSTVSFGETMLLKVYRQLTPGVNPELEMGTFLDAHAGAASRPTPPVLGALSYQASDGTTYGVGIMHAFVASEGDAWSAVERELHDVLGKAEAGQQAASDADLGRFITRAVTLGRRTAEIHLALASAAADDEAFGPEPLTESDRRAAVGRCQAMLDEHLRALHAQVGSLSAEARAAAALLADPEGPARRALAGVFTRFVDEDPGVVKTRIHGDLHLGQVLARGDDFTIIDFEGEPARPLAERRAKSSPLRDVMGMVRSFSYAPEAALRAGGAAPERRGRLVPFMRRWQAQAVEEYRCGYLGAAGAAPFLPRAQRHLETMLDFYALERVIYEVGYELNNRTDWVDIPLAGLLALAEAQEERT